MTAKRMRSFGLYLAAAAFAAVCITKPTSCGAFEQLARPEFVDPAYWNPPSKNFEIIDWVKWQACKPQIPFVLDYPQRYLQDRGEIFDNFWGRGGNLPDETIAAGFKPQTGNVSDLDLSLFHGILGPHPSSALVPEIFRNKVLWMQGNDMFEYLVSFNRAAWRPNTKEGRAIGLIGAGYDWTYATHARALIGAEYFKDAFLNIQMSPDGKWVKLFKINVLDPYDPELEGDWIDMYIVQEGDVFYDSKGNILDYVKPGDIYRLTWHNQGNPYLCDADKLSFSYFARTVASLDEATGTITAVSPGYDDLIKAVTAQPPKDVEAATNDFTTSETMTDEEKFDFLVTYEPDRQMYLSSPPPPFGEVIDAIGSEEGGPGADEVEETTSDDPSNSDFMASSEASFVPSHVFTSIFIFSFFAPMTLSLSHNL